MSSNQYVIGPIQRLVDLNGDLVNFEIQFSVSSQGEFYAAVAKQEDIDKGQITFTRYQNSATGTVNNKSGKFSNYFLILKSPKDIQATVTLIKNQEQRQVLTTQDPGNQMYYYGLAALLVIGAAYFFVVKKKGTTVI